MKSAHIAMTLPTERIFALWENWLESHCNLPVDGIIPLVLQPLSNFQLRNSTHTFEDKIRIPHPQTQ